MATIVPTLPRVVSGAVSHDGQNLFDAATSTFNPREWRVDETVRSLAASGRIPPLVVVGIDSAGRRGRFKEYFPYVDLYLRPPEPEADTRERSWSGRHPALFGALVGVAGGSILAGTMENELFCSGGDDDCLIGGDGRVGAGAAFGAGIGALLGFIAGLGR